MGILILGIGFAYHDLVFGAIRSRVAKPTRLRYPPPVIGTDITKAASLLGAGKLVGLPTETVYGLAGNALDPAVVARIFEVKKRPSFDPVIVHLASPEEIAHYVVSVPDRAKALAQAFMPGPLSLVLERSPRVPDIVTAGLPKVALRVPSHPMARQLLDELDFPLAAPSANPFGYISPTLPQHVVEQLGEAVDYVLDGGACDVGVESTVVDVSEGRVRILRKGGTPVEAIEEVVGPVEVMTTSSSNPSAPGMLKSHYAPRVPLFLGDLEALAAEHGVKDVAVLAFRKGLDKVPPRLQRVLSPRGDLREAAQSLFQAMRELDALDVKAILAEPFPEEGLGRAINDRLRRAAA